MKKAFLFFVNQLYLLGTPLIHRIVKKWFKEKLKRGHVVTHASSKNGWYVTMIKTGSTELCIMTPKGDVKDVDN